MKLETCTQQISYSIIFITKATLRFSKMLRLFMYLNKTVAAPVLLMHLQLSHKLIRICVFKIRI